MDIDEGLEATLRYRAKAVLRKRARALRSAIPRAAVEARSARICDALAALPAVKAARAVALFHPIEGRNEVDLLALDAHLRSAGVTVAYPAIDPDTRVMTFRLVPDLALLEERGLGFREPDLLAIEAVALDVVVVPALQIDGRGHRIGYGAGFYDRALPRYCPPALAVGVAFTFQLVPEVPDTEGDVPLDLIVTDERVLQPTAESAR